MGRSKHPMWNHFRPAPHSSQFRGQRAACKYCKQTVSACPKNMSTHYSNCEHVPKSIGQIPADTISQPSSSDSLSVRKSISKHSSNSSTGPLSHLIADSINNDLKDELNYLFAYAIHVTATPFSFFLHKAWHDFFAKLRPNWKMPSPSVIGGVLLDDIYKKIMDKTIESIKNSGGGTLSIDGATDNLAKSKSNVIIYAPCPLFVEYLRSDLNRETTGNVVEKINDVVNRLDQASGIRCVTNFISDSCNGMRDVRRTLVSQKKIKWAYGCAAHCFNNFCEDIGKHIFKNVVKEAVFISKTTKNVGMIRKIFDEICVEKHKRKYSLPLYCKTRWSSVNFMFQRLKLVGSEISFVLHAVTHERERRKIDPTFKLPTAYVSAVSNISFWKSVNTAHSVYDFICKCIGLCESDQATLSTAYACAINIRLHIKNHPDLTMSEKGQLDECFLRQWNRIYSEVHSLAFTCDPLYRTLSNYIESTYGSDFLSMGHDMVSSCHLALGDLADDDSHSEKLLGEFMNYCVQPSSILYSLQDWQPRLIWGQVQAAYPHLSKILYNVLRAPASTAGVERNHKVNKRVLSSLRCRLGDSKVEKQVTVAHNDCQLTRSLPNKRNVGFEAVISRSAFSSAGGSDSVQLESDNQGDDDECDDDLDSDFPATREEMEMHYNVWDIPDPLQIFDTFLFNEEELEQ